MFMPPALIMNANSLPGTQSVTVATVFHVFLPREFVPRNFAPACGPVAPSSHSPPTFSGDHSPIRVTSPTIAQSVSGAAAMSRLTVT